jgi:hypothetical protein
MFRHIAVLMVLVGSGTSGWADQPLILVENISAQVPNVMPMTYIKLGTTIDLGQSTMLVLDYLNTCVRETIIGGVVRIGGRFSRSDHGTVENSRMTCDGGNLQLAAAASQGGVVYRALGNPLIIRSTSPVFLAATPGTLSISPEGEDKTIDEQVPDNGHHGVFLLDLAEAKISLRRGTTYEAKMGDRHVTFRVDDKAGGADVPLLQRMVPI